MDSGKIKISKLDAARRQLDTAIRLYFSEGDPVAVHTLATAAFEILKDLDKIGPKTGTFYDKLKAIVKPEHLKTARDLFRDPQNFFKHADRDPKKILEFSLAQPEMFLASACDKYKELARDQSAEIVLFLLWFAHQNPGVLKDEVARRITKVSLCKPYSPTQRRQFFEDYFDVAALVLTKGRST